MHAARENTQHFYNFNKLHDGEQNMESQKRGKEKEEIRESETEKWKKELKKW